MTAKKSEDDLVDAGSEYSFPASDPPSYMGGTLVAGPPARDGMPPREPVGHELIAADDAKPAKDTLQETDPARVAKAPGQPVNGGNDP
ncbi:hypothetical protein AB4Y85_07070 [Microvirga sp. 2YAF29]|uniref:hypothetical protein n=1 Tax=Microvirga sp. 2YAF29 TaxID=3233031 RepID=UPI003F9B40A8